MKKLLLPLALLTASVANSQPKPATGERLPASYSTTYQAPVFADPQRAEKIRAALPLAESLYRDYATKNHFPGLAFGIVVDGKLVHAGGAGYTDVAKKTAATPQSLFRIASMSKSVTTMAILKLRDEGKIRLDDPAYLYIPELKKLPYLTADSPLITVRNLMTHSAGFPEDNPWGDRQLDDTPADLINLIKGGLSLSNVPGVTYEYSNLGFAMLGAIITKVSGKPYQQYIDEAIFKPLGMTHTVWEYTKIPPDQLAHGYRWQNDDWLEEPLLHDGSYGAMGGLITSVEDFSKYMAFHQSAWPPRSDAEMGGPSLRPIKRSSVREMQQPWTFNSLSANFKYPSGRACPMVSSYGYGMRWSRDCEGRVYVGHTGGLPGFGSQWWIMPEYGIGVVAYGNLTYAGMASVNWAVLDTLIATAGLKPRVMPVSNLLAQRKAELVQLLPDWRNAAESKIFAENFFPDQSLEIRRKQVQDLYAKAGKIVRVGELIPENQLRGRFLIEGENASIEAFFTLTPENPALIQQLDFKEVKARSPQNRP
ncbi:serine hydrolase domain-containing protein [Larkinella knui]|uniref:Class A beta-lactamase-related serine hydrolase n=1 Tax=Larkinella knui TaxID=2025310 RepID=A0A3P1CWD0_9BACT|nr:serine hydrolase domain-containing protein [Larkinella knui]RRB17529.1 class A beta-lactamase-related serine hydrolase [Larkinella knui]